MYLTENSVKCRHCFRPAPRRLALFKEGDNFECYAESYVKCFWGMCDHHRSIEGFVRKEESNVVTRQPQRQRTSLDLPYPSLVQLSSVVPSKNYPLQPKSKSS